MDVAIKSGNSDTKVPKCVQLWVDLKFYRFATANFIYFVAQKYGVSSTGYIKEPVLI